MACTTGDSQIDAYLRGEMRRWQEDFGFDETILAETVRRSIHAFRPFLLFRGGREAVQETCRDAHDDADRSRRRLNRGGEFGRAGREETVARGTYVLDSIDSAAAAWLQDKTLENIDPEVPRGGWTRESASLFAARGAGQYRQFGGASRLSRSTGLAHERAMCVAAAILEWVDEFQLAEEDVPAVSRAVFSRLLVLQPASSFGSTESVRIRACETGLQWLRKHAMSAASVSPRRLGQLTAHCAALFGTRQVVRSRPNANRR